jgi:hypothetical protein
LGAPGGFSKNFPGMPFGFSRLLSYICGNTNNDGMEIYRKDDNVLYFFLTRANGKTGPGAAVSIFSRKQIFDGRKDGRKMFSREKTGSNCLSCPLQDGRCYTHKGNMARGLMSQRRAILRRFENFEQIPEIGVAESLCLPDELDQMVRGKYFRFGAYGCPTNVPYFWVAQIAQQCKSFTGYTHEYMDPAKQQYRQFFMASTHTQGQIEIAQSMGWRTFTAVLKNDIPAGK